MKRDLVSFELVPEQRRFFSATTEEWNEPAYNVQVAIEFCSPLSINEISDAVHAVSVQHSALRSRIDVSHSSLLQVQDVSPAALFEPRVYPSSAQTFERQVHYLSRFSATFRFELDVSMCRFFLFSDRATAAQHVLIVAHHSICDARSIQIVAEDLAQLATGEPPSDPQGKSPRYLEYIQEQFTAESDRRRREGLRYWVSALSGIPPFRWGAGTGAWDYAGKRRDFTVDKSALTREIRRENTTFVSSFIAFHDAVASLTGQSDVAVGVPVSLRPPGFERTVGMFANILPVRAVSTGGSGSDHAKKTAIWEALDYRYTPLDMILAALPHYSMSDTQTIFGSILNVMDGRAITAGETFRYIPVTRDRSSFDLTLYGGDFHEQIHFQLEYAPRRVDDSVADQLVRYFLQRMKRIYQV